MKKIGIVTVYTGFNYGSSLQAYASKKIYKKLGYKSEILGFSSSLVKGRDIRIEKLLIMFLRTIWRPKLLIKTFFTYKKTLNKNITQGSKEKFFKFSEKYLKVNKMNKKEMRRYGKEKEVVALICGSDQIWSSIAIYVDPFYYLRYFPIEKRVAYAPSFGKDIVPYYNKKIIKKYLTEINYISVREQQGKKIIKELINKEVQVLLDPTLLLNRKEWFENIDEINISPNEKYGLFYFLDIPNNLILENLKKIQEKEKIKIIGIPTSLQGIESLTLDTGPIEFLNLINNAEFICTDSYHGMLFSINFNKPFYIFERNYGNSHNQNSRIVSILEILKLKERYVKNKSLEEINWNIDWNSINEQLNLERKKAKDYIVNALEKIEEKDEE
jgi:hypothetical protein